MADLKAKDYRRMFLEEIGFPLVKANAQRFVAEVGDLRKVENLKLVFEAAMRWKSEQRCDEQVEQLENQLKEKEERISYLEEELGRLQIEPSACNNQIYKPEQHLANYLAETPEVVVERVVFAVLNSSEGIKAVYHSLSKAFHPDTSSLPKDKATKLFAVLSRLYERNSNDLSTTILNHDTKEVKVSTEPSYVDEFGLDDIEF